MLDKEMELKACPFCGEEVGIAELRSHSKEIITGWYIFHPNHPLCLLSDVATKPKTKKEDAIYLWNTRPQPVSGDWEKEFEDFKKECYQKSGVCSWDDIKSFIRTHLTTPKQVGVELEKILPKEFNMGKFGNGWDRGFNEAIKQIKENHERIYGGGKNGA